MSIQKAMMEEPEDDEQLGPAAVTSDATKC